MALVVLQAVRCCKCCMQWASSPFAIRLVFKLFIYLLIRCCCSLSYIDNNTAPRKPSPVAATMHNQKLTNFPTRSHKHTLVCDMLVGCLDTFMKNKDEKINNIFNDRRVFGERGVYQINCLINCTQWYREQNRHSEKWIRLREELKRRNFPWFKWP